MGALQNLVDEGRELLASENRDGADAFIRKGEALLLSDNPAIRSSLYKHRQTVNGYPRYTDTTRIADIRTIIAAAELALEQREIRLREI